MTTTTILSSNPTLAFLGECTTCVRPVRRTDPDVTGDTTTMACPECAKTVTVSRLYATRTMSECNGACMGAVGPYCSCGCAGTNHGRVWGGQVFTELTLGDALARRRAEVAEAAAKRAKRAGAARAKLQLRIDAFREDNPQVAEVLAQYRDSNDFIRSVAGQLDRDGYLSDRQIEAVIRFAENEAQHAARQAQRDAERVVAGPVPTGTRVSIQGTVVHIRCQDSHYGYNRTELKMLVVLGNGSKVWSTVPAALARRSELTGSLITFVADVTTKDDPAFGLASRPTAAKVLATAAELAESAATLAGAA